MSFSRHILRPANTPKAPPVFTWTEYLALPLALSVMEAQPLAMALIFLTVLVGGPPSSAPLGVGEIVLLLLGLLWWAMMLAYMQGRGRLRSTSLRALLRLGGLLVAWALVSVPFFLQLKTLGSGPTVFLLGGELLLVFWFWRRGLARARLGFMHETLATSFKIGLGTLLVIMLLVLLIPQKVLLLPTFEASLTIFFLSGLVTLSLARLGALRQVRLANGKQADPTRAWLGALLLFSSGLIALIFLLEAVFSYASFLRVLHVLQPVWNGLGTLVGWLLYFLVMVVLAPLFDALSWVINRFKTGGSGQTVKPPSSPLTRLPNPQHATPLSPELLTIGRWVVLAAAALLLLLLVRASLRRWFLPYDAEQFEETREHLEKHADRQTPRKTRKTRRAEPVRFPETAGSARAYYRVLLQTVATAHPELAHLSDETPLEYEQRLRPQVEAPGEQQEAVAGSDPLAVTILQTLTQDYMAERYGQQPLASQQQAYLHQWMPRLLQTFGGPEEGKARVPEPRERRKSRGLGKGQEP